MRIFLVLLALAVTAPLSAQTERLTNPVDPPGKSLEGVFVGDPSFEAGTPNPVWTEASTNFGTPLCTLGACGSGTGTGPRTGDWWAWFGGVAAFEEGSVSQSVAIPDMPIVLLHFWVEQIVCGNPTDFLEVLVDGVQVWQTTGADPSCGVLGYREEIVDISAFRGLTATLEFHSTISGTPGLSNFFVDDVDIEADVPVTVQSFSIE